MDQLQINVKDVQDMFMEKDMQILQFRAAVRELGAKLEQNIKELEKCRQNNTESDSPQ